MVHGRWQKLESKEVDPIQVRTEARESCSVDDKWAYSVRVA